MAVRHDKSRRKPTGGRHHSHRKLRKHQTGGPFTETTLGEKDIRKQDARGNTPKDRVKQTNHVSLAIDGEVKQVEITGVLENPANPDYVRRDILTQGTIIDTSEGRARVTSRPGQDGTVNAVLLEE